MSARAAYRVLFAAGLAAFLLAFLVGLGGEVVRERRLPPVESEQTVARTLADLREFAVLQPRNPIAYLLLGRRLMEEGDDDGAIDIYRKALALNPTPAEVNASLARLYARTGQLERAREQARIAWAKGERLDPRLLRALDLSPGGAR